MALLKVGMMYWKLVTRTDQRARALADRHYSRKTPGYHEFCPPGNNLVLLGLNDDALWVTHRPDPTANLETPRMDGFGGWDNPYFRNESTHKASELIRQAVAASLYLWGLPNSDGLVSFTDQRHVKPTMRRGQEFFGYVFLLAGFKHLGFSQERKLWRWILDIDAIKTIQPEPPMIEMPLFGGLMSMEDVKLV